MEEKHAQFMQAALHEAQGGGKQLQLGRSRLAV